MYSDILFPTDGSDAANAVLQYAVDIATEHGATVHVLHVVDTNRGSTAASDRGVLDTLEAEGQAIVDAAVRRVRNNDVPAVADVRRGDPYRAIVDYSDQSAIDCIVMPTHGRRGVHRYLLGSVTERVINTTSVPVTAVNPGRAQALTYPPRHVLVPTDGSLGAELALTVGLDIAEATGATLHLLHVVEAGSRGASTGTSLHLDELPGRANEVIADATARVAETGVDAVTSVYEHREPSKVIRDYIDENDIDLAVLGTHGQTDFSRYVMGGVSAKIVRTAPVPVVWVRDAEPDAHPDA